MKKLSIVLLCVALLVMFLGLDCARYPNGPDKSQNQTSIQGNGNGRGGGGGHDNDPSGDDEGDDDSDRPPWAGGNPDLNPHVGDGNPNPGVTKGGMYGDLYILYRDDNGEPILNDEGLVQVIAFQSSGYNEEGEPILIYDSEGFPIQYAEEGEEGFVLEYNEEGDLVVPDGVAPAGVEFGRINLVRSPPHVLASALAEAGKALTASNVLCITQDFCGRLTAIYEEVGDDGEHLMKTIDSPRENMAMYKDIMTNAGTVAGWLAPFFASGSLDGDLMDVAASCFAAGGDKTGIVLIDEIVYVNTFLGVNITSGPGMVENYFDFSGYDYSRAVYDDRQIRMKVVNGEYDENREPISINQAASSGYFGYTGKWNQDPDWSGIFGFRTAADDAVQVLEFVHGDSNIEYIWNGCPEI
jgi:hypothetical protein